MTDYTITYREPTLLVHTSTPDALLALPQKRWSKVDNAFHTNPSIKNLSILSRLYKADQWSPEARALYASLMVVEDARERNAVLTRDRDKIDLSPLEGRQWGKYTPFTHQKQALALASDLPEFGYFMDMGTGKSLTAINDAAEWWRRDKIELVIVVCPNSVKTNWRNPEPGQPCELETHRPVDVPFVTAVWISPQTKAQKAQISIFQRSLQAKTNALHWLVVNIEAISTTAVQSMLHELVEKYKTMIVVDESTRIKNHSAQRTKIMLSLSRYAVARRIMSGTPVIKAPENAWAQLRFLGPEAMPFDNVTAFKKKFVVSTRPFGFQGPEKIEGYQNLAELSHLIDRVSFRITKDQCLDLPPKMYHKRYVNMLPEQLVAYEEMRKRMYVFLEQAGLEVAAPIILVQMLRLQQIACGFLPRVDEAGKVIEVVPIGDAEKNPKFVEALDILEDTEGQKTIIWCTFTAQLTLFSDLMKKKGIDHVLFYGAVSDEDRVIARQRFQDDDKCRVFLGNPAAGGIGLTLTAAEQAIYLSNSFKTEDRVQSEDRCHRIGSERHHTINYHDVMTEGTIEAKVIDTLRSNKKLSDEIMREGWKSWL